MGRDDCSDVSHARASESSADTSGTGLNILYTRMQNACQMYGDGQLNTKLHVCYMLLMYAACIPHVVFVLIFCHIVS